MLTNCSFHVCAYVCACGDVDEEIALHKNRRTVLTSGRPLCDDVKGAATGTCVT